MNVSDVLACSFPEWYDRFAKVTMKSIILPLPDDVLSHLLSKDSLRLPKECDKDFPSLERHSDEEAGEDEAGSKPPSFPAFSSQIEKALEELGRVEHDASRMHARVPPHHFHNMTSM